MTKRNINFDMMRGDHVGQRPDTNKDPVVGWSNLERELIELKGIKLSRYGDFSGESTHKYASGKVITSGWSPCNVDVDDGSYDTSHYMIEYENFNKFLSGERM